MKELRLAGISTKEEATTFFREVYIPKHNSKFAVAPKDSANLHRPLLSSDTLKKIFTIQSQRIVSKDLIVQYKNRRYQLLPQNGYRYTLRKTVVLVIEDNKGRVSFHYKDKTIPYRIAVKTIHMKKRVQVVSAKEFTENRVRIPRYDHPWKQVFYATQ